MKKIGLLIGMLALLASCTEVEQVSVPATEGETVTLTRDIRVSLLPIQRVGGEATTRAALTAAEATIHNAYVLQFDGTASTGKLKMKHVLTPEQLKGEVPIACSFQLTAGVKNRVYVVANVPSTKTLTVDVTTLADFEAPVTFTAVSTLPATGLPFSAMQDVTPAERFDLFQLKSTLAKLTMHNTDVEMVKLAGIPRGYSFAEWNVSPQLLSGMTYVETNIRVGTAYYLPENLSGKVTGLTDKKFRCKTFAPANAMCLTIELNSTTYDYYLGEGSADDFNVVRGNDYSVNLSVSGTNNVNDPRIGSIVDLSALGTANCYVASTAAWYSFDATVMGNGKSTPLPADLAARSEAAAIVPTALAPVSAEVLWETLNTTTAPAVGEVVSKLYLLNGRVLFWSGNKEGNAVIAAKNASGDVLWSWHIWRTNEVPAAIPLAKITATDGTVVAAEGELKVMDRNLGALRAISYVVDATKANLSTGLLYQWGRKDPFPGGAYLTSRTESMATSPGGIPATAVGGDSTTPADGVKNPTKFYTMSSDLGEDWCSRNDNLWGTPLTTTMVISNGDYNTLSFNANRGSKTIYDPCPPGWRTPPGYAFANAALANGGAFEYGFSFAIGANAASLWFPAAGSLEYSGGWLLGVGTDSGYWASSTYAMNTSYASGLGFYYGDVYPGGSYYRTYALSVRCVRE